MNCECLTAIDAQLKAHNARLSTSMTLNRKTNEMGITILLGLEKIDKKVRKPLPVLTVTFCPFCGADARARNDARKATDEATA